MNLPEKKNNETNNPYLDMFSFFQANLILVPFPTHRKQVLPFFHYHLRMRVGNVFGRVCLSVFLSVKAITF